MTPTSHDARLAPGGQALDLASLGQGLAQSVIPTLAADRSFQQGVGTAAGAEAARQLKPWVIAGVGLLGVLVALKVVKYARA